MRKILSPAFLVLQGLLCLCAASPIEARDDFQYWNEFTLKARVREDWWVSIKSETWLREDASDLYLANVSAGPVWAPSRYWETGFFYRYEFTENAAGDDIQENRYYPELTLKLPWKRFVLSTRGRMEYRDRSTKDSWRYRHQFKLAAAFHPFKHKVTPFVSDEIFADTISDRVNQNRFLAGFSTPVFCHTEIRLFYLLKSDKQGADWSEAQVVGTGLDFVF